MVNLVSATKSDRSRLRVLRLDLFICLCMFLMTWPGGLALAQDRKTDSKQTGTSTVRSDARTPPPASSKIKGLGDRSFKLILPPLIDAGLQASLESGRVPMTPDESLGAAKKRRIEAEDLQANGTVQSLRAAMSKYEDALRLLSSAGRLTEPGEMAQTFNQLASIADALGERPQAINYYNQSLPLWRAANDRQNEATTLTRLGRVYNSLGDKQQAQ